MTKPMPTNTIDDDEYQHTRPFLWFLTLVLVFLFGLSVYTNPTLQAPLPFILFTSLLVVHGLLHWKLELFLTSRTKTILYFGIQIALVIILTVMSNIEAVGFGLFMGLAGETVGILADWRRSLLAMIFYLALMVVLFGYIWGWAALPDWTIMGIFAALFVGIYVLLFMRQITLRAETQALLNELEVAHAQLAGYAQQVETLTLETERQRMARELHDTLAQGLAGLVLQLEALEANLEHGNTQAAVQIASQAKSRARTTLSEARQAIDDLRVQDKSLGDAVNHEVSRFTNSTGISCKLAMYGLDKPSAFEISTANREHVVRCVSEGLSNVARHAQATDTAVIIKQKDNNLRITIKDDGIGFDTTSIPSGHYGLIGLRERARLAGGTLTVESKPGVGTTVDMYIPLT